MNSSRVWNQNERPRCLVTVDVEGDDLWSRPRTITTRNAKFLPRFQSLCEAYSLRPTYLANFEMVTCPAFQEFGRDVIRRGRGEIGMHLHAWNSPPLIPLTSDDFKHHPYLIEYSQHVMRQKITFLTKLSEDTFGVKMTSHRAGRWGFNAAYAYILVENGYQVDSSVTPHLSWGAMLGDPSQLGGPDYSQFPDTPYLVNLEDISRPGTSSLLEVPVTTQKILMGDGANHFFVKWLRPNGRNLQTLLRIVRQATEERRDCVVFMVHSSELMPGGSPTFRQAADIESLYKDLEVLFSTVSKIFYGVTLADFYRDFCRRYSSRSNPLARLA
jgi:hypothetical protein